MSVDPKLLEILVCPVDKTPLEVIELPEAVRRQLVDKYRDQFKSRWSRSGSHPPPVVSIRWSPAFR